MQTKKITLNDIVIQIKGFRPLMPNIETINFTDETVTVSDVDNKKHTISLNDASVSLTRVIKNDEPI